MYVYMYGVRMYVCICMYAFRHTIAPKSPSSASSLDVQAPTKPGNAYGLFRMIGEVKTRRTSP